MTQAGTRCSGRLGKEPTTFLKMSWKVGGVRREDSEDNRENMGEGTAADVLYY